MNYYTKKQMAYKMIDNMIIDGRSDEDIINRLNLEYGFGDLVFKKRKEILMYQLKKETKVLQK